MCFFYVVFGKLFLAWSNFGVDECVINKLCSYLELSWQRQIYLLLRKWRDDTVNHCIWARAHATPHKPCADLWLWVFTFNDFGNSLWFLIDQIWVAVDGGDLREVWAWAFKTKLLDPKARTICPSHTKLCMELHQKCITFSFPPWTIYAYKWTYNMIISRRKGHKHLKETCLILRVRVRRPYPQWYEARSPRCIGLHLQTGSGEGCWKSLNDLATVLTDRWTDWQVHTPRKTPPPPPPTQSQAQMCSIYDHTRIHTL